MNTAIEDALTQLNALPKALESDDTYKKHHKYYESNAIQYYKNILYQGCEWAGIGAMQVESIRWIYYFTNKYRLFDTQQDTFQMRNIADTHWCEDAYWSPCMIIHNTQPDDVSVETEYRIEISKWFKHNRMSITKPWYLCTLAGCRIAYLNNDKEKFLELFRKFCSYKLGEVKF